MTLELNREEYAALKLHLEDVFQSASLTPEATGAELVASIDPRERGFIPQELEAVYLRLAG